MRRILAVLVLLAAAMVAASAPASAGGVVTTIVSKSKLPNGVAALRENCPEASPSVLSPTTTAFRHVFGPQHPPLGKGSLLIRPIADKVPGLRVTSAGSLANLTQLRVQTDSETGEIIPRIFVHSGTDDWVLSSNSQVFVTGWADHPINLSVAVWFWQDVTANTNDSGTIAQFVAAHPPAAGFKVELLAGGCASVSPIPTYFDDLELGLSGSTTKYNFESTATGLTIKVSKTRIAAGGSVKVSTVFSDGGVPLGGRAVDLLARKKGATTFSKIVTIYPTSPTGGASATLKPTKTTTYKWRFVADGTIQGSTSPTKTVTVTH